MNIRSGDGCRNAGRKITVRDQANTRSGRANIIDDVRAAGARIRLITDGDLSAGISAAVAGTNIHACIRIGGAPEGVLPAAAVTCLNRESQARRVLDPERLGL